MTAAGDVDEPEARDEIASGLREVLTDVMTDLALRVQRDVSETQTSDDRPKQYTTREQLGHQVLHNRKVTFYPPDGDEPITGYLAGWDLHNERDAEKNYLVLVPEMRNGAPVLDQHLIPQASRMMLHRESTYDSEPLMSDIERIVVGFRYYVSKRVLPGRGRPSENDGMRVRRIKPQRPQGRGRRDAGHS